MTHHSLIKKMQLLASAFILFVLSSCSNDVLTVSSPNGKIGVTIAVQEQGDLSYTIVKDGKALIENAPLGFLEKNGVNLNNDFAVVDTKVSAHDEVWKQPWGENKEIRNHYNEILVELSNKQTALNLTFKVFNDGVGFRYQYDVANADSIFITDELTAFNITPQAKSWSIPASFETYELLYRTMDLDSLDNANTPITLKTEDGTYLSIHEAALTNFPEMTIKHNGNRSLKSHLAHWPDGIKAKLANKFQTPWRTIQIGDKAVDLINSGLILNLNEPSKIANTSWIKPMKYIGVWWGMHVGTETWVMDERHGATTANAIKYIDFAAAHNIEGVLFEGWNEGWENWGGSQMFDYTKPYADFDIEYITKYAKEKGIEIIGHHETGGFITNYEAQLEKSFKWYKELGIHSVKTGYAGAFKEGHSHHGQYGVRHYRKVVEDAAKFEITINAHEPIKPTGIRRTYPNMMTREGARGMEWNAWSEGNPADHYLLLPFTRILAGPMDYTPGTFDVTLEGSKNSPNRRKWNDNDKGNSRVNTTLTKQIAMWVILYSPLQMASDMIENYEGHPAFQFFVDFDADSDWSKAIAGEIGEYIAVVRKADDKFFLGAATNAEARTLDIKLDFLEDGKTYEATIYADGDDADWVTNPTAYKIEKKQVTSKDAHSIVMATSGGQAIVFEAVK
jgi:alpha-glucosidase